MSPQAQGECIVGIRRFRQVNASADDSLDAVWLFRRALLNRLRGDGIQTLEIACAGAFQESVFVGFFKSARRQVIPVLMDEIRELAQMDVVEVAWFDEAEEIWRPVHNGLAGSWFGQKSIERVMEELGIMVAKQDDLS